VLSQVSAACPVFLEGVQRAGVDSPPSQSPG